MNIFPSENILIMGTKSFTINDLPKEERPREKMMKFGAHGLTDKELLMALLGRGIGGESIMVTTERLWGRYRNLKKIANASVQDLSTIRGIGGAKAVQIKAAFELSKRASEEKVHEDAHPFIKWAGGKGQLLSQYSGFFPPRFKKYFEPFVGGGAVFFYLKPQQAILSDLNEDLMNTYEIIKRGTDELVKILREYQGIHSRESYYHLREDYNAGILTPQERAAAFIYLNKTAYNGLYRVNSKGEFNVPFGDHYKNLCIFSEANLRAVSQLLKRTQLYAMPFEGVLDYAQRDDFIYFDPPYYPVSKTSNFTSYTQDDFFEKEQKSLARVFHELDKRGCKVMLSNSDTDFIKSLYLNYRIETVKANRFINCIGGKRGSVRELVILNY